MYNHCRITHSIDRWLEPDCDQCTHTLSMLPYRENVLSSIFVAKFIHAKNANDFVASDRWRRSTRNTSRLCIVLQRIFYLSRIFDVGCIRQNVGHFIDIWASLSARIIMICQHRSRCISRARNIAPGAVCCCLQVVHRWHHHAVSRSNRTVPIRHTL